MPKPSKYLRVRLDFVVHFAKEIDSIPLSREMMLDLIDDAAEAAVKKLGSKGLEPQDRHAAVEPGAPWERRVDEAAAEVRAGAGVPVGYTDGHVRCDIFTPRRRKSA